jgi:hypothetical protein
MDKGSTKVYVVVEEMRGMKRRRKIEDVNIVAVCTREGLALSARDRLLKKGKQMGLKHYVVRIEEHELVGAN